MSKHTPGPWHRGTAFGQEFYVFDANGDAVVSSINKQDVPLIAAAPELLAALNGILFIRHATDEVAECMLIRARAAIAKATGGEP